MTTINIETHAELSTIVEALRLEGYSVIGEGADYRERLRGCDAEEVVNYLCEEVGERAVLENVPDYDVAAYAASALASETMMELGADELIDGVMREATAVDILDQMDHEDIAQFCADEGIATGPSVTELDTADLLGEVARRMRSVSDREQAEIKAREHWRDQYEEAGRLAAQRAREIDELVKERDELQALATRNAEIARQHERQRDEAMAQRDAAEALAVKFTSRPAFPDA